MTDDDLHNLAFDFVKNLAWLIDSYTSDKADTTAASLVDLIKAIRK